MKFNRTTFVLMLLVLLMLLSGCGYVGQTVNESQLGLKVKSGKLVEILGPGRHSAFTEWYASLVIYDCSAKTVNWNDPDLVTRDKQPIGIQLSITYARSRLPDDVRHMWTQYNREARKDDALQEIVLNRVPRVAKAITTKYSLNDMLGIDSEVDRAVVTSEMKALLTSELAEMGILLLDVGIDNIAPDPEYMALLKKKANATISKEVAQEETLLLAEQLLQEEAQTDIELEKARRQQEVAAERAKTYEESEEAYELRKLELMSGILGDRDKIIFLPTGADITMLFGGEDFVPVPRGD